MKNNFNIIAIVLIVPLMSKAAEQTWLQNKIRTFTHTITTRHTYDYNSFKHIRDRIALYALPSYASQYVLAKQRANMINFLDKNRKSALEGMRQYFNIDTERWQSIVQKGEKKHAFNLNAMRQTDTALGHHDDNVPSQYRDAVNKEAARYSINSKNLNLELEKGKFYGTSFVKDQQAYIVFNPDNLSQCNHYLLSHTTIHELTHLFFGDNIIEKTILNEITQSSKILKKSNLLHKTLTELDHQEEELYNKKLSLFDRFFGNPWMELLLQKQQYHQDMQGVLKQLENNHVTINDYLASDSKAILTAAQEKRADTYAPCQDPEAARNAVMAIKSMQQAGLGSYPNNYNDMEVIYANWQTSQAITDFKQFKQLPQQKLSSIARSLHRVVNRNNKKEKNNE